MVADEWRLPRPVLRDGRGNERILLASTAEATNVDDEIVFPADAARTAKGCALEVRVSCNDGSSQTRYFDGPDRIPIRALVPWEFWQKTRNLAKASLDCKMEFKGSNGHGSMHEFALSKLVISGFERAESLEIADKSTGGILVGRRGKNVIEADRANHLQIVARDLQGPLRTSLHCNEFANYRRSSGPAPLEDLVLGEARDDEDKRADPAKSGEFGPQICRISIRRERDSLEGPWLTPAFTLGFPKPLAHTELNLNLASLPDPGELIFGELFSVSVRNDHDHPLELVHVVPGKSEVQLQSVYSWNRQAYVGDVMNIPVEFIYRSFARVARTENLVVLEVPPHRTARIRIRMLGSAYTCSFVVATEEGIRNGADGVIGLAMGLTEPLVLRQYEKGQDEGTSFELATYGDAKPTPTTGALPYFLPTPAWVKAVGNAVPKLLRSPELARTSSCYDRNFAFVRDHLRY